jgi:hypothetical protein
MSGPRCAHTWVSPATDVVPGHVRRLIHAGGRSRSGPHWPTAGAAAASRGPFLGPVPRRRTKQTNPIRYGLLVFVSVLNAPFSPLLSG